MNRQFVRQIRRLAALSLCGALTFSPSLAAENRTEKFPVIVEYPGFSDVGSGDWFFQNAKLCYEIGLMQGTDHGFAPYDTLTVAQVVTVAARIRETLTGEAIPAPVPNPGIPWYQHYVDYLTESGVSVPAPEQDATRLEFVQLLSAVLPDGVLSSLNAISSLPDTSEEAVLNFYRSGILTGIDSYGTFAANRTLMRAECAAMVSRIAREELRLPFSPADYTPFQAAGLAPDTLISNSITAGQYLPKIMERIAAVELSCAAQGVEFNWQDPSAFTTTSGSPVSHFEAIKVLALVDCVGLPADMQQGDLFRNTQNLVKYYGITDVYKDVFDPQVFYAKYISLTGTLLGVEIGA